MTTAVRLSRKTFYNYNLHYVVKGKISDIYCTFLLFFSKGTHQTQVLKSKGFCVISRAHTGTNRSGGVVWWCQLWKHFLPAPKAPHTIFSANADTVDIRGKGPGLSTLSSKCTHSYFLSMLSMFPTMTYRPVWLTWVSDFRPIPPPWQKKRCVQVQWRKAKYEQRGATRFDKWFTEVSLLTTPIQWIPLIS